MGDQGLTVVDGVTWDQGLTVVDGVTWDTKG